MTRSSNAGVVEWQTRGIHHAPRRVHGALNPTWFRAKPQTDMHYVYVLLLTNGQLYVGRTDDLRRRYPEHRDGKVVSTRHRRPLALVFYEAFQSRNDAIRRERYLKTTKGKSTLRMMLSDSLK